MVPPTATMEAPEAVQVSKAIKKVPTVCHICHNF